MTDTKFSILDLIPIREGHDLADGLANAAAQAVLAEELGFNRYWVAEHHGMPGIGGAATSVVLSHLGHATERIRIGSGGIMLPNHSPLQIAEQFGTLDALFPGRIDLGLGRAPGTDQLTARALRRDLLGNSDQFPQDVQELQHYFDDIQPGQAVKAIPGAGLHVPIWILGSSMYGAQLAAHFGLPYAFASHFAPDYLLQAMQAYKSLFKPSTQLAKSHAMVGVNVVAADTDEQAQYLFTSHQQNATRMRRNTRGQLPPPIDDIDTFWTPHEKASVNESLACSVVGSPETVQRGLARLIEQTGANELMIAGQIFDHKARLHSFEIAAQAVRNLESAEALA